MKNTLIQVPSGDWILPSSISSIVLRFLALDDKAERAHFVHVVYKSVEPGGRVFETFIRIPVATAEDGWAMMRQIVMDMGVTVQSPNGLPGLSIQHKADGCWMTFQASNGQQASVRLQSFANDRGGGIIRSAILQWIEDVKPTGT